MKKIIITKIKLEIKKMNFNTETLTLSQEKKLRLFENDYFGVPPKPQK